MAYNLFEDICAQEVEHKMECVINITWDEEAAVWVATSEDVPGLVLESGSFDALVERVRSAVPELLQLNQKPSVLSILMTSQRRQTVYA